MAVQPGERNLKQHPWCDPHDGTKGVSFERVFLPNFYAGARGESDSRGCTVYEYITGTDEGGRAPSAKKLPDEPTNPNTADGQRAMDRFEKASAARKTRGATLWKMLRMHIPSPAYHRAIDADEVASDGLKALAIAKIMFQGEQLGAKTLKQEDEWSSLKLTSVGVNELTINSFGTKLQQLNGERAKDEQKSEDMLCLKLMDAIKFPRTLTAAVDQELAVPTLLHPAQHNPDGTGLVANPLAGRRSLAKTTAHFDSLWQAAYRRGDIRNQPAPKSVPHKSNRIDGMHFEQLKQISLDALEDDPDSYDLIEEQQAFESYVCTPTGDYDEDGGEVYELHVKGGPRDRPTICFNCFGADHMCRDRSKPVGQDWVCPSPKQRRDMQQHIAALTKATLRMQQNDKPPRGGSVRIVRRGQGGRPMNRFATRPPGNTNKPSSSAGQQANALEGAAGFPEPETLQTAAVESNAEHKSLPSFGSDMTDAFTSGVFSPSAYMLDVENSPDPYVTSAYTASEQNVADVSARAVGDIIDTGASKNLVPSKNLIMPPDDDHPFVGGFKAAKKPKAKKTGMVASAAAAAGYTIGMLGTVAQYIMPFLLGLLLASAIPRAGGSPIGQTLTIDADSSNMFTFSTDVEWVRGAGAQHDCVLFDASSGGLKVPATYKAPVSDTGASQSASGQRKLFPTSAIEKYHPNVTVRVANGQLMRPEFQGIMVLKCRAARSSKKFVLLPVEKALYIAGLNQLVLVSPRTLFKLQGIRSYYNDEMYMLLPNGFQLPFVETATGWSLDAVDFDATPLTFKQVQYALDWVASVNVTANGTVHSSVVKSTLPTDVPFSTVHERCMHSSFERIVASDKCTRGLPITNLVKPTEPCRHCIRGSAHKHTPQARPAGKYTYFGQCVCSDAIKMPASTPFGYVAMVDFYDRATKFLAFYFLRTDSNEEMKRCFDLFVIDNKEYLRNGTVTEWYFDNHGQFVSGKSELAIAALGTKVRSIVPWNPQMNPAERPWGDVLRGIRISLAAANVSEAMWPFPAMQYAFVHNALMTRSATAMHAGMSPNQMRALCGPNKLPGVTDMSHLGVMFCYADVLVQSPKDFRYTFNKTKVSPTTTPAVHLGIHPNKPGFIVYLTEVRRLTTSAFGDTWLDESVRPVVHHITGTMLMPDGELAPLPTTGQQMACGIGKPLPLTEELPKPAPVESFRARVEHDAVASPLAEGAEVLMVDENDLPLLAFSAVGLDSAKSTDLWKPRNFEESDKSADKHLWREAGGREYNAKMADSAPNKVGVLVDRPTNVTVLPTKVVFDYKFADDNSITTRTCRWVGCGNWQDPAGVKSYTATARSSGYRCFGAACLALKLHMKWIDVSKAFTTATIDVDTYVEQMDGYVEGGLNDQGLPNKVVFIEKGKGKSLEGLRQSGYLFQNENVTWIKEECSLTQLETEPCVFRRVTDDDPPRHLMLYWHVDDCWAGYSDEQIFNDFHMQYRRKYKTKIPSNTTRIFTGVMLNYNRVGGTLELSQPHILERAAEKFFGSGKNVKHVSLPATYDMKTRRSSVDPPPDWTCTSDADRLTMKEKPYLSLIATLYYVMCFTQGDTANVLARLGRYMADPPVWAWTALVLLFGYMYHRRNSPLTYRRDFSITSVPSAKPPFPIDMPVFLGNLGITIWSDASWKTNNTYAGHIITVFGAAVDWQSKLVRIICHSSAEAEICAGCFASKRAMYVLQFFRELGFNIICPLPVMIDNTAADSLSIKHGATRATEHFLRWQHDMRHRRLHRLIDVHYVSDPEQRADAMTKVSTPDKHHLLVKAMYGAAK